MSLKLAKGPLIGAIAVLLLAGLAFASKSIAPDISLAGLRMGEFGDLIAIALGVFALMLAALSFVMAKPVPKAAKKPKKEKKKANSSDDDVLDMLDDDSDQSDATGEEDDLDDKARAKLAKQQAAKERKAAKEAAALKKKEEKEAARQAKQAEREAKKAAKKTSAEDDSDDTVDLFDEEFSPDGEALVEQEYESPVVSEAEDSSASEPVVTEEPEEVTSAADNLNSDDVETAEGPSEMVLTEAEMLEEAGPEKKKLTPAEKKAEREAKREAAKKARLEAKFQKQAAREAAKAARAAEKAAKKGLEEDNSYDMLEDGEILPESGEKDQAEIVASVEEDVVALDVEASEAEEPAEAEADLAEDSQLEESDPGEEETVDPEAEAELDAEIEKAYEESLAQESEVSSDEDEVAEEETPHAFATPQPAVDPRWMTDAFSDDRFVVPFSNKRAEDTERMEALMARMELVLEKLESSDKTEVETESDSKSK